MDEKSRISPEPARKKIASAWKNQMERASQSSSGSITMTRTAATSSTSPAIQQRG